MELESDAFVFFGATGDLASKQIFPALQAMIRHGHLDIPIIGVARSAENRDQLRAHVVREDSRGWLASFVLRCDREQHGADRWGLIRRFSSAGLGLTNELPTVALTGFGVWTA
jgi:hypothetical protein